MNLLNIAVCQTVQLAHSSLINITGIRAGRIRVLAENKLSTTAG